MSDHLTASTMSMISNENGFDIKLKRPFWIFWRMRLEICSGVLSTFSAFRRLNNLCAMQKVWKIGKKIFDSGNSFGFVGLFADFYSAQISEPVTFQKIDRLVCSITLRPITIACVLLVPQTKVLESASAPQKTGFAKQCILGVLYKTKGKWSKCLWYQALMPNFFIAQKWRLNEKMNFWQRQ